MSLDEQMKHDIRMLDRHCREIGRDLARMEREKKTLITKIKAYAKKNNIDMVNELAMQAMVYKVNIKKITKLQCNVESIKQKLRTMRSVSEIQKALVILTHTMKRMNEKIGDSTINSIIRDYDRELNKVEINMEMADEALTDDIDEEEQREIVSSILEEIGVEVSGMLKQAPTANETTEVEKILESRLKSLLV